MERLAELLARLAGFGGVWLRLVEGSEELGFL